MTEGYDHELEEYIEKSKRLPEQHPMRRGLGIAGAAGIVPSTDLSSDIFDPGVRLHALRERRAKDRLEDQLDRLVPVEEVELTGATVAVDVGEEEVELREDWAGTAYRVKAKCLGCGTEHQLVSIERPGLQARSVAAGVLRRRPGTFTCDECISRAVAAAERAETEAAQKGRLTRSGLDPVMHGFEFSQMIVDNGRKLTVDAARNWAASEYPEPRGLCIFGGKGAGKTRLAGTAVHQRVRRWGVTWVSWPILIAQLGAAFDDKARAVAISVLTGKGALALDDIAQEPNEKVSDWARRQIFAAVDRRVSAGAPLLITTNLDPAGIGEVLGEKLMSRIVGYCRVLELPGEDQRLTLNFDGSALKDGSPLPDDFLPEPQPGEYLTDPDDDQGDLA